MLSKNCGGYGKRQLGGDSKYRLNCKPTSLWEKTQNKSLGRSPPGMRILITDLKTIPSKESQFDQISL